MDVIKNSEEKKYLVFRIGEEEYGADIRKVTTIIEKNMSITRVPRTPDYIIGVINLRGDIIPIMDLRKKFDLPEIEDTEDTRIIIIHIDDILLGLVVDSVVEVVNLTEESIESLSNFSSNLSIEYIFGVGKVNGRIITILNLENLIKLEEI
ncbi:MAG TPA: chemotaxis protein CheW [Clostridiaceae bacterium]|nr:chemotaxis protein CheW [Clostridiaceae bacterium]